MGRAIVLFACLIAAAGVAAYTHFSHRDTEPVYTVMVPHRPADPIVAQPKPPAPVLPPQRATATPGDRASLARELQRELKRVGCYSGDISGVWTTSSRMAMKSFTDHVNASLPIDNPDYVLLSLVQGYQNRACAPSCPPGQAVAENGQCIPSAVQAKIPADSASETKAERPADKSAITTGSIVPATAAAATALAVTVAVPKSEAKTPPTEDRPRSAAMPPTTGDAAARTERPERSTRQGGPVPPERVHERRQRRTANGSQTPKFVRNLFRALGIN